jgi:hypothetical protein
LISNDGDLGQRWSALRAVHRPTQVYAEVWPSVFFQRPRLCPQGRRT